MHPSDQDWKKFNEGFFRLAKLDLNQYKADQMRRRILGMVEAKGLGDLDAFLKWLNQSNENVNWFQDKMAINVSELFRNPEKWEELAGKILPELLEGKSTLKCWSAGCSYGAEAHTLASIFASKFKGKHQIIGSDIDQAALAQAKSGLFAESDMRNVPDTIKANYFTKVGDQWQASQEIRNYCTFKTANLLESPLETGFDLIMCRNVVIYFTEDAKNQLYQRFMDALRPGGYLFVGSTERIFRHKEIGFETPVPFFYQKPKQEGNRWRNAS